MNLLKDVPEMSTNFCDRVMDAARDIPQRRPWTIRRIINGLGGMLPVRINWAVAMVAIFFVAGIVMGTQTYTFTDMYVEEILEL